MLHVFYIMNAQGEMSKLSADSSEVVNSFENHQADLRKIIRKQKLKMNQIEDVITLVKAYNRLG